MGCTRTHTPCTIRRTKRQDHWLRTPSPQQCRSHAGLSQTGGHQAIRGTQTHSPQCRVSPQCRDLYIVRLAYWSVFVDQINNLAIFDVPLFSQCLLSRDVEFFLLILRCFILSDVSDEGCVYTHARVKNHMARDPMITCGYPNPHDLLTCSTALKTCHET